MKVCKCGYPLVSYYKVAFKEFKCFKCGELYEFFDAYDNVELTDELLKLKEKARELKEKEINK